MLDQARGKLGYYELAKILSSKGFSINEPDLDKGIDMIASREGGIAFIQIKTVIYDRENMADASRAKTVTAAGSRNGKFSERYKGLNLVVMCFSKDLTRNYTLVFPPNKLPQAQSLRVPEDSSELDKYAPMTDNFEKLKLHSFISERTNLLDFN